MTNDNSYHLTAADSIRLGTCGIHGDRGYWLSLDMGPMPRNAEIALHFASSLRFNSSPRPWRKQWPKSPRKPKR